MLAAEAGRLGVTIVETHPGDATGTPEAFRGAFDRVLLDAPCSGLGTLRRNPEIRWRIAPADLEKCRQIQRRLLPERGPLREARRPPRLHHLRRHTGGERECRRRFSRRPSRVYPHFAGRDSPELIDADGFFRTFPHRHGTDGFFGAVFIRAI